MSPPAVEVQGLGVRFGDATILSEVSFTLAPGQWLAVIGPNGAGKSTLVRCLDGLIRPAAGTIEIGGRDLTRMSRREIARRLSYVPQADDRALDFSVQTFVEMGRYPHVRGWATLAAEDVAAVRDALDLTETDHLAERHMSSLSGGERQRVHMAAALAQGGSILLLDEPTSFLDYRHQVQLGELLLRLRVERQLSIVAVTHDLNSSVAVSDRVLALKAGATVFAGPPQGLFEAGVLEEIYDTPFDLVPCRRRDVPLVVPTGGGR